jgi:hypothetical protein
MGHTNDLVELLSVVKNKGINLGIRRVLIEALVLHGYRQHLEVKHWEAIGPAVLPKGVGLCYPYPLEESKSLDPSRLSGVPYHR